MNYAADTAVPISQSKGEVERMLKGAGASNFFMGETDTADVIGCKLGARFVRFAVKRPDRQWADGAAKKRRNPHTFNAGRAMEAEYRRRWRCMALLIKGKLAAVAGEIRTVEEEFLADTMLPDNRTVYEAIQTDLALAYEKGTVGGLLQLGPVTP